MLSRRRLARLLAFAAAIPLLAGCTVISTIAGATGDGPGTKPTGETVAAGLGTFYEQDLDWKRCLDKWCTTVSAPLDWADPTGDSIGLAVVFAPAKGRSKGSLFVNPGGPGGSGFDFIAQSVDYAVSAGLRESYDVVGWDPRGVSRSDPITCVEGAAKDDLLYGTFDQPYDTQGWIDELAQTESGWADACAANTGPLLEHIDTGSVARDLDLMRAVLGNEKLTYLGYSYGTSIGATYAELFPEKVGRMVLDGAVDPLVSDFEALKVQMTGFENGARAYMAACLSGSIGDCPFTGTVEQGLAQLRGVIDGIDERALTIADGRQLDEATLGTGIAWNLYTQSAWPSISAIFVGLEADDAAPAFQSADGYNGRSGPGTYDGNGYEAYTAVTCADGDFADDPESTLDRLAEIDAAAPTVGLAIALDDFAVLDTVCSEWPGERPDLPTVYDAEGAPPILVIGTSNDPATPYQWAVSLADQLSSGVLISHEGEGHTVYNQGVACVDSTVDDYFLAGTVPSSDPMC